LKVQVAGGTPLPFTAPALEQLASKTKLKARAQLFLRIIRVVFIYEKP
jgi:hypothetical protein